MAASYVKFVRGTASAFKTATKNKDTLYFITDTDTGKSLLYLGDKVVSGDLSGISNLNDVLLSEIADGQLLTYDGTLEKWVNKDIIDAIPQMVGAENGNQGSAGLVPPPGFNAENFFLRGDGVWAPVAEEVKVDSNVIELLEDNVTISLKSYGKKYYKFIASQGSPGEADYVAAHYQIQTVDNDHPWIEGLEPRVVSEDGVLVLGWFEPNYGSSEELEQNLTLLNQKIDTLNKTVSEKADSESVYTKEETDEKIQSAVQKATHLNRKIFTSLEEAEQFALEQENPTSYIYLIPKEGSDSSEGYEEYLWDDGALVSIGSWSVDLSDYATKEELDKKVSKQEGHSLISNEDLLKLQGIEAGAQKNIFDSVDSSEFSIDENQILHIAELPITKVTNLSTILEETASALNELTEDANELVTKVASLETLLSSSYVLKTSYDADMTVIKESITWRDL